MNRILRRAALAAIFAAAFAVIPAASQAATKAHKLTAQDYAEINQLYAAYAWALDTGDGPGRAAVFTKDGMFASNQSKQAWEPIEAVAARTAKTGNVGDRHLQYNILIEQTPDGVKGKCYVLIVRDRPNGDAPFKATPEMYNDTLVKTKEGWRFKTRQVWSDFAEESPYKSKRKS